MPLHGITDYFLRGFFLFVFFCIGPSLPFVFRLRRFLGLRVCILRVDDRSIQAKNEGQKYRQQFSQNRKTVEPLHVSSCYKENKTQTSEYFYLQFHEFAMNIASSLLPGWPAKILFVPLHPKIYSSLMERRSEKKIHHAGFVSVIGKPNVGKSTLVNALTGEKLSIITPKAQTTRHRIRSIANGENYQVVFSDTPGIIDPAYLLQEKMMGFVESALEDADIILIMTEPADKQFQEKLLKQLLSLKKPVFLVINKIDQTDQKALEKTIGEWNTRLHPEKVFPVSALHQFGIKELMNALIKSLPVSPPYFPKDQVTDLSEKFFISEIIREKILLYYKEEIPYSVQAVVESFKDQKDIIVIKAVIYTEKESQKNILIGTAGSAIKRMGTQARKSMEQFLGKKVFLELFVKVKENWRKDEKTLKDFGY